ncbi:MAG: hypothetical protein MI863_22555 [Desulfobacterales bacterium]|nr:hypothetical protein [Desulfobacterales bacterium]
MDLALSEKAFKKEVTGRGESKSRITIGDYFPASGRFLLKDHCFVLKTAFREQTGKPFGTYPHPVEISLSLEKHGAFYHPIKVIIRMHAHPTCSLVMNGAVSDPGPG